MLACLTASQQGNAAGPPRIIEVAGTVRTMTIGLADEPIFVPDRASHFRFPPRDLPKNQRRVEYLLRWTPSSIDQVRFEYRQINVPNRISEQTASKPAPGWTVFTIAGDEFTTGGAVSAWRVSLWKDGRVIAEKKSVLW